MAFQLLTRRILRDKKNDGPLVGDIDRRLFHPRPGVPGDTSALVHDPRAFLLTFKRGERARECAYLLTLFCRLSQPDSLALCIDIEVVRRCMAAGYLLGRFRFE